MGERELVRFKAPEEQSLCSKKNEEENKLQRSDTYLRERENGRTRAREI